MARIDNPGRDDDPGYALRLEIIDGPTSGRDEEGWEHYAYTVRLHYDGRRATFPWRQGVGITHDPSAEDVVECLLMDAASMENARDFEDWATEYGYDTDSRKAERLFRDVGRQTTKLRRLLGSDFDRAVFPTDYAENEAVTRRLVRSGRVV